MCIVGLDTAISAASIGIMDERGNQDETRNEKTNKYLTHMYFDCGAALRSVHSDRERG